MTTPAVLTSEIQKLAPEAVIELFVLDATSIGGEIHRFHAGTNDLRANIVWQGETYVRYPIKVSGFEFVGQGSFPRPKMLVANILSAISALLMESNDLLQAKVIRKRTMKKFLDAVNFDGGVNPDADDTAEFQEDIYYIDRKSSEDRDGVEFELASSVDLVGVSLPRRQVIQNVCTWEYRGPECGYTGAPLYDENDEVIASSATVPGQAVLDAYADLNAATAAILAAETALSEASRTKDVVCSYAHVETVFQADYNSVFISGAGEGVWRNGVNLGVGSTGLQYRRGALRITAPLAQHFNLEVWSIDAAACTAATTAYDDALIARDAAQAAYAAAVAAIEVARAALPADDPLYSEERCGKRLSSCKARFGANSELPFGSFPAAGLVR